MSMKLFFALAAFSILLSRPGISPASDFLVTLKNGATIPVNSYAVKGDKLVLTYPLGSAEIALSQVSAVTDGSRKTELLQIKGEPVPAGSPAAGRTEAYRPYIYKTSDRIKNQPSSFMESRTANIIPASLEPDPRAAEIDALIDKYSDADETQAEVADKELDLVFSAFFDDP